MWTEWSFLKKWSLPTLFRMHSSKIGTSREGLIIISDNGPLIRHLNALLLRTWPVVNNHRLLLQIKWLGYFPFQLRCTSLEVWSMAKSLPIIEGTFLEPLKILVPRSPGFHPSYWLTDRAWHKYKRLNALAVGSKHLIFPPAHRLRQYLHWDIRVNSFHQKADWASK